MFLPPRGFCSTVLSDPLKVGLHVVFVWIAERIVRLFAVARAQSSFLTLLLGRGESFAVA